MAMHTRSNNITSLGLCLYSVLNNLKVLVAHLLGDNRLTFSSAQAIKSIM